MIGRLNFVFYIFVFIILSLVYPDLLKKLKSLIPLLLGLVMLGMGLTIKVSDFKDIFKNPSWIYISVILQFLVMPFTAFLLTYLFKLSPEIALGLIIVGSCPGGTASNVITYLCKGNVTLSVVSTFLSTLLSIIATPLLISNLADVEIDINIIGLIKSVFLVVFFPVSLGIFINIFFNIPNVINKLLPRFSEFVIAFIIGIIISLNLENIGFININLILCILLHNLAGLSLGYIITYLLKFPDTVKKTVSIEVGMQNSGLGMTLAIIHFGPLVALPSAIFSFWHNISAVGLVYLWKKK